MSTKMIRVGVCQRCRTVFCNDSADPEFTRLQPIPRQGECDCGGQVVVTAINVDVGFSLTKFQEEQREWALYNFGEQPYHRQVFGVVEELGELAHAFLKLEQGIRGDKETHVAEAKDSVGDLMVYLAGVCSDQGWSLEEIISTTWEKVKSRNWRENPEDGGDDEES